MAGRDQSSVVGFSGDFQGGGKDCHILQSSDAKMFISSESRRARRRKVTHLPILWFLSEFWIFRTNCLGRLLGVYNTIRRGDLITHREYSID